MSAVIKTKRYSKNRLLRARPQKFTKAGIDKARNHSKEIADLEWQVKFTKMKLGLWRDLEKDNWTVLEDMHKQAKARLKQQKQANFG